MTDNYGLTIDQNGVAPVLRRIIAKSPNRHKLNLLFALWPPAILMLDCIARRVCADIPTGQEDVISRAIFAGLKAADGVGEYKEPAWPLRVVEAFMLATMEFAAARVPMLCGDGVIFCGSQNSCKKSSGAMGERQDSITLDVAGERLPQLLKIV